MNSAGHGVMAEADCHLVGARMATNPQRIYHSVWLA